MASMPPACTVTVFVRSAGSGIRKLVGSRLPWKSFTPRTVTVTSGWAGPRREEQLLRVSAVPTSIRFLFMREVSGTARVGDG